MLQASHNRSTLLDCRSHMLIVGGPGSGKTTICLQKAQRDVCAGVLKDGQQILFLSFARSTITRVQEQAVKGLSQSECSRIEINTYHGFAWSLLRSHGYLIRRGSSPLKVLPPPQAASRLANFAGSRARNQEKGRLFQEEGLLHFDLFAGAAAYLLTQSQRLSSVICDAYPIIIIDEFQDTNLEEWRLIQQLGRRSLLIALADPEQRIYEFRGADPNRISQFKKTYQPECFDFGNENHRSTGTDILTFGNDLLALRNQGKKYSDVEVEPYQVRRGPDLQHWDLKLAVLKSRQRLLSMENWSLAVLVPSRQLMIEVSRYLGASQEMSNGHLPGVDHEVALDAAGPSLAAAAIAGVLEGGRTPIETSYRLVNDVSNHIKGRKGDEQPSRANLELAAALDRFVKTSKIRGPTRNALVNECWAIGNGRHTASLSGDPSQDWLYITHLLEAARSNALLQVAADSKFLRLLKRGAVLRSKLIEIWKENGCYLGAADAVREALLQEHFELTSTDWRGIHVMTIHKAKGKEFDEVVVYEGAHQGRIARQTTDDRQLTQSRLALRVAVTRARQRVTILTPSHDPCPFL